MAYCAFDKDAALFDATPVDNMFISEYMLRAPGDYVKVYLYALMLCAHPSERMSNASMARDLDMTEEDVVHAFRYWSRSGLVRQVADNPPAYVILSAKQLAMTRAMNPGEQLYHREFMEEVSRILGGRTLAAGDCQTIFEWMDVLELPEEVVLMLLQTEMKQSGGRVSIRIADQRAREWARSGIRTVEDVERIVILGKEREQDLKKLLRRMGQLHQPSDDEKELYSKWLDEWGFTPEAVQEACRETTSGVPTMKYLDGILLRQHQKGRHDAQEMAREMHSERDARDFAREIFTALGRMSTAPTEEDLAQISEWRGAGADDELILLAAAAAHRRAGGGNMEEIGAVLERWRARGLITAEAVRKETERVRVLGKALRNVYEAAGVEKRPTAADREQLAAWKQQFSMELIMLAAEFARKSPNPMGAMASILSDWQKAGITTPEAARQEHEKHTAAAAQPAAAQTDYQRRSYTEEDFRRMEVDLDAEVEKQC